MNTAAWTELMERVQADYAPGTVTPPGSGSEGDDPLGLKYADLGPLAYVLNEALDSAIKRGGDREALLELVLYKAGEDASQSDLDGVLAGKETNPPRKLLEAFASVFDIDTDIIFDAAGRGGGADYKTNVPGPGY